MERQASQRFRQILSWTTLFCFELIVLGSLVRTTDSGLACPDWPMCFGVLVPAMNMQIFLEWFHRLSALILGGLLLSALVMVARNPELRRTMLYPLWAAGLLFLSQCILGGLTVLELLDPTIVSAHLANATLLFAVLLWALVLSKPPRGTPASPRVSVPFALMTLLVFAQILLGGAVATNHASLVCPDFPTCLGRWFPPAFPARDAADEPSLDWVLAPCPRPSTSVSQLTLGSNRASTPHSSRHTAADRHPDRPRYRQHRLRPARRGHRRPHGQRAGIVRPAVFQHHHSPT